jgi:hypothetical protein
MGDHRRICLTLLFALFLALGSSLVQATVVVDDSWADGGRTNGADPTDSNWWTSASSAGIEVSVGSLGLVTGTTGRGIHTVFPTQTLANVGDSVVATYVFTTPATLGTAQTGGFRVGLFDTLGRAGLNADVSSSSGSPNSLYGLYSAGTVGLPGYMLDMDVNTAGAEDFNIRQLDTPVNVPATTPTGRLMGTTTGFTSLGDSPNGAYTFAPNTQYTGSLTLTRTGATEMTVTGTLGAATFSVVDPTYDSADVGMLAFWANSNVFGSSSTAGSADNGIDFSNVKVEFIPSVPEPGSLSLLLVASGLMATRRPLRSRRQRHYAIVTSISGVTA